MVHKYVMHYVAGSLIFLLLFQWITLEFVKGLSQKVKGSHIKANGPPTKKMSANDSQTHYFLQNIQNFAKTKHH